MSEPLRKNEILYAPCNQLFTEKPRVMLIHIGVIPIQNLRSALEWLKERMVTNCFDKELVDLAFPAIYEKEKGDDENGK